MKESQLFTKQRVTEKNPFNPKSVATAIKAQGTEATGEIENVQDLINKLGDLATKTSDDFINELAVKYS